MARWSAIRRKLEEDYLAEAEGIHFAVTLPKTSPAINADWVNVTEIHDKLQEGYEDIEPSNMKKFRKDKLCGNINKLQDNILKKERILSKAY